MPPSSTSRRKLSRNALVGLIGGGVAIAMVGAAYAAVPLYKTFCQLTGFDGTIRAAKADGPTGPALDRTLTVKFDTNVRNLPWTFRALQRSQEVQVGLPSIAFFEVTNDSDKAITGRATYNLVPETAASYFLKTQCFCFDDQTIQPHTTMKFPVVYYVEKGFATDAETRNFQELTLSYTFFPKPPNG
jgi:cytochrome c oxidase assembly protein subunit 11